MSTKAAALLIGIGGKVFLGEAYPSGNAYLEAFPKKGADSISYEARPPLESWPSVVSLHCMSAEACGHPQVGKVPRKAHRDGYYDSQVKGQADIENNETPKYLDLIPMREGIDPHGLRSCNQKFPINKKYFYADNMDDYFESNSEACVMSEAIARYKVKNPPKNAAYRIVAIAGDLTLSDISYGKKNEKRSTISPKTLSKKAAATNTDQASDCTTEPRTIDDADILFKAKVKGTKQSLRISWYRDPGCYGHLSEFYILDLMEAKKISETYLIRKDGGVL